MKATKTRILVLGALLLAGSSTLAFAHEDRSPPPGPMMGHPPGPPEKLLAAFDSNKDGKITKAELDAGLAARFAAATHGAKLMTADQFAALHQEDFQKHAAEMFKRVDWNGDGKLSFDEFLAPERARFQMMDRDGSGVVSCRPPMGGPGMTDAPPPDGPPPQNGADRPGVGGPGAGGPDAGGPGAGMPGGRPGFGGPRGFGGVFAEMCRASGDGKVTRAAFEAAMHKDFDTATGGQPFMTAAMFTADLSKDARAMSDRMFQRLDRNGDGKLDLAEFSAPERAMFERLDRNHDGVVDAGEMKPDFRGPHRGGPDRGGPDRGGPPADRGDR